MKNDILKISGVNFSKFSYFWPAVWGFGGFRGHFKHFDEHMQKESPRGGGNDQFGSSSKLNLEVTKNEKNDEFLDFKFESRFEAGVPQGSPQSIFNINK